MRLGKTLDRLDILRFSIGLFSEYNGCIRSSMIGSISITSWIRKCRRWWRYHTSSWPYEDDSVWAISWSPSCRLGGYFRCRCHMVWSADCSWELVSLYVLCIQYRDPAEIILPSHTIGYDVVCCVDPRGPRGSGTTHLCRRYVPGHATVPEGGSRLMVRCRSAVDYGWETRQVHGPAGPLPDVGIWDMTGCKDRHIDSVSAIVTTAAIRVCHLLSLLCRCSASCYV